MGFLAALAIVLVLNIADGLRVNHNREVAAQTRADHQQELIECWNAGKCEPKQ